MRTITLHVYSADEAGNIAIALDRGACQAVLENTHDRAAELLRHSAEAWAIASLLHRAAGRYDEVAKCERFRAASNNLADKLKR